VEATIARTSESIDGPSVGQRADLNDALFQATVSKEPRETEKPASPARCALASDRPESAEGL
jgi:hypothetical protein